MKKVLILVTQSEWGGAQKYVFDLAKNLRNDFDITVGVGPLCHSDSEARGNGELIEKLKTASIKVKIFKNLVRQISPIKDLVCFFQLIKFICQNKFDVVHTNSSKAEILGNIAAKIARVKTVVFTAHGFVYNEPMSKIKRTFFLFLEKLANLFSDKVICVSEFDRQTAIKAKICKIEKLVTIHNGLDFDEFNRIFFSSHDKRAELGLTVQNFVIGTVANFYTTKGLKYLIVAAEAVVKKFPNTRFIIVGDGELRFEIEKQIKDLNLQDKIILTGFQKDIHSYLKTFDLFVLSSVKEGLPFCLLEASAAGLPIVATKVGGIPEIVESEKSGLLVEPAKPQLLADAIVKIMKNENLICKYGQFGMNNIKNKFDLKNNLKRIREIYV